MTAPQKNKQPAADVFPTHMIREQQDFLIINFNYTGIQWLKFHTL